MSDSADNNSVVFHIKQDAIIARSQAVGHVRSPKVLNVAVKSGFQSFNLPQNLSSNSFRQGIQIIQSGRTVFDPITTVIIGGLRLSECEHDHEPSFSTQLAFDDLTDSLEFGFGFGGDFLHLFLKS